MIGRLIAIGLVGVLSAGAGAQIVQVQGDDGGGFGIFRVAALRVAADREPFENVGPQGWAGPGKWFPETEKAPFLGVSTGTVPPALREQLKLPRGVGLVVETLSADGPAEKAGVKRYDVLHKLNDQILITTHQFSVLVRTFKAGDEVKLTLIRQGESKVVSVKLGEAELPVLSDAEGWGANVPDWIFKPGDMPKGMQPWDWNWIWPRQGAVAVRSGDGMAHMVWTDGKHTLSLTSKGGKNKVLEVYDMWGKVIFKGGVDTEEQRKALPADIREKLEKLEKSAAVETGESPAVPDKPATRRSGPPAHDGV